MNRIRLMSVLFVLLVATVVACNPTPTPDVICDANTTSPCISLSKFSANISNTLNGNVVGYVSMVGTQPSVFGGNARMSPDQPSMAMLPNIPINIASVSKVLTTIGVLQSLAKHNLTIDSKISPYIWPDWFKGDYIDTITFRDLLTHKSGFRMNCGGSNTTYSVLQQQIAMGVDPYDKTIPSYNNCNFAIFRELLLFMEGYTWTYKTQAEEAQTSAAFYINYMNQHVFAPLGIPARECKPAEPNVILSYPMFNGGVVHGDDWGDWTLACGGGGWVMTAGDLFKVVDDLANGNILLTNDEKTLMNSNCLGWDCSVRSDCPYPYVCKNGDLPNGSISVWTYLGIFKCNVPVVVVMNSQLPNPYQPLNNAQGTPLPNNGDIIGLVRDAYNNAAVTGSPSPCPVQLTQQIRRVEPNPPAPTRTPLAALPQPRVPIETQPAATRTLAPAPRLPVEPQPTATRTLSPVPRGTQRPRAPVLVAPIDGTAMDCGRVNLTWKPAEDPSGVRDYDVELEKLVDRAFVSEKTWNNLRAETTPFDATCETHYRWRARATDNAGNPGLWSSYGFFRVKAALTPAATPTHTPIPRDNQGPQPPVQLGPIDGISVNCVQVNLTWKPAVDPSGIRDYDVELEKLVDRTYTAEKTWNNVRAETVSFDPTCDTHYRWRIRATDNAGNQGSWTEYQDFGVRAIIQ